MTSEYDILARLASFDADLSLVGDDLLVEAPAGAIDDEFRAEISLHKARLVEILLLRASRPIVRNPAEFDDADRAAVAWFRAETEGQIDSTGPPPAGDLPEELQPFAEAGDQGSLGYRTHLASIRRIAARKLVEIPRHHRTGRIR